MSRNIIFLDIDGVMLPGKAILLPGNKQAVVARLDKRFSDSNPTFDPIAIHMINSIVNKAEATIVLNTTWAFGPDPAFSHIKNALIQNGLVDAFHSTNPKTYTRFTGSKLISFGDWVEDYGIESDKYLVLDDDINSATFSTAVEYWATDGGQNFEALLVQPDYNEGLSWAHYKKSLEFFNVTQGLI
jgi:hypothetical protein